MFGQKREFGQRLGDFAQIHTMFFEDFTLNVSGYRLIEIISAQAGIPAGGEHFEHAVLDP